MLVIIDYGLGNLRSVQKIFERLNYPILISSNKDDIKNASKLILPGVGHFSHGIKNLEKMDLIGLLNEKVIENKTPILGICLGMQLMTDFSEEGNVNGLGWVKAQTMSFSSQKIAPLKIPHVGWNNVFFKKESKLLDGLIPEKQFYFVHSYFVKCKDERDILTETDYGIKFNSSFNKENIYGVQFHPEKSHFTGLKLLSNFYNL